LNDFLHNMNEELLVKYLLGEISLQEQLSVEEWINSDQAHKRYFEHFRLIWEKSKLLAAASTVDENAAWLRFQQRINGNVQPHTPVVSLKKKFNWLAMVAILAGVVLAASLYYVWNKKTATPTLVVSDRRVLADTLPDGSVVTLNKNSSISYPRTFTGNERPVNLKGEAFFDVKPNRNKPFVVHVNDISVTVVGTSFNIKTVAGKTEIVVETGVVKVSRAGKTVEMKAGDRLFAPQADSSLEKDNAQDKLYNYYRSKQFVCDQTPLWKLVEVLNEAYDAHIVIEDNDIRSLQLTTTFNNESLDNTLQIIAETFAITVEKKQDKIILK
jgi:transmembrane sensor